MSVYITLAAVAVLIFAYPHIRIFFKHISLALRLHHFCRQNGVTITASSPLWFLTSNRSSRPALFLETASHAWALSLFSVPKRASTLILSDNGTYQIETYLTLINVLTVTYNFHNRARPLAAVNYYTGAPDRVWVALHPRHAGQSRLSWYEGQCARPRGVSRQRRHLRRRGLVLLFPPARHDHICTRPRSRPGRIGGFHVPFPALA